MVTVGSPFLVRPGMHTLVVSATLQWPAKAIPWRPIPPSNGNIPLYLRAKPKSPLTPTLDPKLLAAVSRSFAARS